MADGSSNNSEAQHILLSRGARLQEQCGAVMSGYCNGLVMGEGLEFSFEELQAEKYFKCRDGEMDENLRHLKQLREHLTQKLEDKNRLLLVRRMQQQVFPEASSSQRSDPTVPPAAASFQFINQQFLVSRAVSLRVNSLRPSPSLDPPQILQRPVSKVPEKLSPIQETSVETNSLSSLGGLSAETCSPLEEQDQEQTDQASSSDTKLQQMLPQCFSRNSFNTGDLHSEPGPLPAVEENGCLQLGGELYLIFSRVVDGGSFSVYNGATEDVYVLIKVDSCSVPWDFHQFTRLKKSLSSTDGLPLISCFQFVDGCFIVYTTPPDHMFTGLADRGPSELSVGHKAISLLKLVSQLHSCRLVHATLQPQILTCSRRGFLSPYWVFPVDWSSSVDLDFQQDVGSVRELPSAQTYINLGLLELTAPPQLQDDSGEGRQRLVSSDVQCDMFSRMWKKVFRSLLNADGQSSQSVVLELHEQLLTLYR
ncbi:hypothetical protein Q5P01_004528 [Channa striata]|uniref:Protein kinase domain-containing protein n=1 Tax=Channa striata TaxID=64152 RepID=A0AA88NB04_CHASR|nr:hypothetical protein Q5P01_004528 [Channa striata]